VREGTGGLPGTGVSKADEGRKEKIKKVSVVVLKKAEGVGN